ncbi:hypothetical protein DdX_09206 [Ditylenchus destructor]|uniref:Uncharacterized protein n=1 Tax=Ditylenchus destructor TaxID=166010 RepID=A0AAD4R3C5_9BILA|nr:hypothetical protein DdX_09206 [Ditylenchus destructor]
MQKPTRLFRRTSAIAFLFVALVWSHYTPLDTHQASGNQPPPSNPQSYTTNSTNHTRHGTVHTSDQPTDSTTQQKDPEEEKVVKAIDDFPDQFKEKFMKKEQPTVTRAGFAIRAMHWIKHKFLLRVWRGTANICGWKTVRSKMTELSDRIARIFDYPSLEAVPTKGINFKRDCHIFRHMFDMFYSTLRKKPVNMEQIKTKLLPCNKIYFGQIKLGDYEKQLELERKMKEQEPELAKTLSEDAKDTVNHQEIDQKHGPNTHAVEKGHAQSEPELTEKQSGPRGWRRMQHSIKNAFSQLGIRRRPKRFEFFMATSSSIIGTFFIMVACGLAFILVCLILYKTTKWTVHQIESHKQQ